MILKHKAIVFMHRLRDGLQTVLQLHGFETCSFLVPSHPILMIGVYLSVMVMDHTQRQNSVISALKITYKSCILLLMLLISCNPWMFLILDH